MKDENTPAQTMINTVCGVKRNERVLIIANPETDGIAQKLFEAARAVRARPVLIFQPAKKSFDNAAHEVLAAIASNPDVCLSISAVKLGKDPEGIAHPYKDDRNIEYDHIFDYLLYGKKSIRAVWTPGITPSMYERTVQIDYEELARRCTVLEGLYENAVSVHVTAPGGTDVTVPVNGRKVLCDNGVFSRPGTGGNIPSGEVFISPVVGTGNTRNQHTTVCGTSGTIVFDGSMTFGDGDALLKTPITVHVDEGFVKEITGGSEALRLEKTIHDAETNAVSMEKEGRLPAGMGSVYSRNARNIGELGIGLNPSAVITGNMLEDEKAFRTCHFAIGENYDSDAPSLIHLDGVVRDPTISITYADSSRKIILRSGEIQF
ncbi:MAG: peptidase M17 [Treponema sp.]|nr:peptidase M17 [Treponema sp.]